MNFSNIKNIGVDDVPPRAFNRTGAVEDEVTMGLRHLEDNGPQPTPTIRCRSNYFWLISF